MGRRIFYLIVSLLASLFVGFFSSCVVFFITAYFGGLFLILGIGIIAVSNALLLWGMLTAYKHGKKVFRSPREPLFRASAWNTVVLTLVCMNMDSDTADLFYAFFVSFAVMFIINWYIYDKQAKHDELEANDPQSVPPDGQSENQ